MKPFKATTTATTCDILKDCSNKFGQQYENNNWIRVQDELKIFCVFKKNELKKKLKKKKSTLNNYAQRKFIVFYHSIVIPYTAEINIIT